MLKNRYLFIVMGMLLYQANPAIADMSIGIGLPNVNIGINIPAYPELVRVPGYPVYYAPQMGANFFFYDGMYWIYQNDNWYTSAWYNGPWEYVDPDFVPLFILRIPVRYYGQPPAFFRGWQPDGPPRWGHHWGPDWERRRYGWDQWNHSNIPAAAPLPAYQQRYSGTRYPRQAEQQQSLQKRNYHYQPHNFIGQHQNQRQVAPRMPAENGAQQRGQPYQQPMQRGQQYPQPTQREQPYQQPMQRGQQQTQPMQRDQPHPPPMQREQQQAQPMQRDQPHPQPQSGKDKQPDRGNTY
jgi:hypothetical protein